MEVKRALAPESEVDSLITTTTTKEFTDGTKYKEVKKVTMLADASKEAPKPEVKKTTTINNSDRNTCLLYTSRCV